MLLIEILIDTLIYSCSLALVIAGIILARHHHNQRMANVVPVMIGVFVCSITWLIRQLIVALRPSLSEMHLNIVIDRSIEILFLIFTIIFTMVFFRALAIMADSWTKNCVNRKLVYLPLCFFIPTTVGLIVNDPILTGLQIPLEGMYMIIALFRFWRRIVIEPVRQFKWMLLGFFVFGTIVEVVVLLLPQRYWVNIGFSQYFLDSIVLNTGMVIVFGLYIRAEWLAGKAAQRLSMVPLVENLVLPNDANLEASFNLSPRELEVVNFVCLGKTNQEIAELLFVSLSTVKSHIHSILRKTGQNSRTALVVWLTTKNLQKTEAIQPKVQ